MGRTVRDANLETRTARLRLPIRSEPYWRGLEKGFALGYRRRSKGGTWLARRWQTGGVYAEHRIGTTDDFQDADGVAILDYSRAQKAARQWWRSEQRREQGYEARTGPFTVSDAVAEYLVALERRGGRTAYHARRTAETHVLPILGSLQVTRLTSKRIEDWHYGLVEKAPLARSKPGESPNYRRRDISEDGIRARRATANRVLTVLKAALNHAWKAGHVPNDDAWRRARPFKAVDAARVRYLTLAEAKRLLNACAADFRLLVQAALMTGARYGTLTQLTVADFNPDSSTVAIRTSRKSKPYHAVLNDEGAKFFRQQCAGRAGDEVMLRRKNGSSWGMSHQLRPILEASKRAKISPTVNFHCTRHTWASHAVMNGVPLFVVAKNLGHADTRMVEKHYGHLAPSYIADAIRAGSPRFGIDESNVQLLR
jgi:integrase